VLRFIPPSSGSLDRGPSFYVIQPPGVHFGGFPLSLFAVPPRRRGFGSRGVSIGFLIPSQRQLETFSCSRRYSSPPTDTFPFFLLLITSSPQKPPPPPPKPPHPFFGWRLFRAFTVRRLRFFGFPPGTRVPANIFLFFVAPFSPYLIAHLRFGFLVLGRVEEDFEVDASWP